MQIGTKRFQIGTREITNRGQGLQIDAEQLPLCSFEYKNTYILIKKPLNLQIHNPKRKRKTSV